MKQIHELNERSAALALGDFLPVDNGNDTEKIDYTKLAKAIIEQYNLSSLGGSNRTLKVALDALQDSVDDDLVPKTDIVNNVTTSTTGKVLDASQGKVLQDQVTALNSKLVKTYTLVQSNVAIAASSYTDVTFTRTDSGTLVAVTPIINGANWIPFVYSNNSERIIIRVRSIVASAATVTVAVIITYV